MNEMKNVSQTTRRGLAACLLLAGLATFAGCGEEDEARVFFVSPENGATVSSPVTVQMAAEHFTIEAAGDVRANHGHFHVIVDDGCVTAGEVIPRDAAHFHYGDGQATGELELQPGAHHLCLQIGDGAHVALPLTQEIDITVE